MTPVLSVTPKPTVGGGVSPAPTARPMVCNAPTWCTSQTSCNNVKGTWTVSTWCSEPGDGCCLPAGASVGVTNPATAVPKTSFSGVVWDGAKRWSPGNDCNTTKGASVSVSGGNDGLSWHTDGLGGHFDVGGKSGAATTVTLSPPTNCGYVCGTWEIIDKGESLQEYKVIKTGTGCGAHFNPMFPGWRTGVTFNIVKAGATVAPSVAPTACPAQYDFIESNQSAINTYCRSVGQAACSAPKVWASLSCHRAVTGWSSFGPACTSPYCTGCACVAPSPTTMAPTAGVGPTVRPTTAPVYRACNDSCSLGGVDGTNVLCSGGNMCTWTGASNKCRNPSCLGSENCVCAVNTPVLTSTPVLTNTPVTGNTVRPTNAPAVKVGCYDGRTCGAVETICELDDAEKWRSTYFEGEFGQIERDNWAGDFNCDGRVEIDDWTFFWGEYFKIL